MRPELRHASRSNMASNDVPRVQWRTSGEKCAQTHNQQGTCPYRELCRVERSPIALQGRGEPLGQRKRVGFGAAVCPLGRRGSLPPSRQDGHCARAIFG